MNCYIEDLYLQRLVDGEMSCSERTEFLRSLDDCLQQWREVTLVFVKEQVWSCELAACESDAVIP